MLVKKKEDGVLHTFNPSTPKAERQEDVCEFKASLVYLVSSRIARAVIQRNHVSKNKQTKRVKHECQLS